MTTIKEHVKVTCERVEDMTFKVRADNGDYVITIDKTSPHGSATGPTPTRLLAAALLGCLTSSLTACVEKGGGELALIDSVAELDMVKDDRGFVRVHEIEVTIRAIAESDKGKKRIETCKRYFEEQCTVTSALREGVRIKTRYIDE